MEVVILPGTKQIGALAADAIEALVRRKPNAVLGLATGSSPPTGRIRTRITALASGI